MINDINRVFRVTNQMLGYPGPRGDSHRNLQLCNVHPTGCSPTVLVEKEVITSHTYPRTEKRVGMSNTT